MHYSGILVASAPDRLPACAAALSGLPGLEIHYSYPELGRLIVVQETRTRAEQEEGLRRIQGQPGVLYAELVYYHVSESPAPSTGNEEQAG